MPQGSACASYLSAVPQESSTRRALNKDTRINLATAQLFKATDYLQVR